MVVLMAAAALCQGVLATSGLEWPGEPDLFRDMAQAQTFAHGDWQSDPFYEGEAVWYNPLLPGLVAIAVRLSGTTVHQAYVRLGPYLNFLAPLTFALLATTLFGHRAAAASTLAFLFLQNPRLAAWQAATYSPWLLPGVFTQCLFYLSLAVYIQVRERPSAGGFLLVGLLGGLTLLGHTAPAILLCAVVGILSAADLWRADDRDRMRLARHLAAAAVVAIVVGLPLLWPIVGRYRLRVLNPNPAGWVPPSLEPAHLRELLVLNLSPVTVLALAGLVALMLSDPRSPASLVPVVWAGTCVVLFGYGQLPLFLGGQAPPTLVPSFHFLFYLKALESLLFGPGLVAVCALASRWIVGRRPPSQVAESLLVGAVVLALFAITYPSYARRADLVLARAKAQAVVARSDRIAAVSWIEEQTDPGAVFLGSDALGLFVVGAAGRKVVAVESYFTNPYLDWRARDRDRRRLFECLRAPTQDEKAFRRLADPLHVRYVIVEGKERAGLDGVPFLKEAFSRGSVSLYAIRE